MVTLGNTTVLIGTSTLDSTALGGVSFLVDNKVYQSQITTDSNNNSNVFTYQKFLFGVSGST